MNRVPMPMVVTAALGMFVAMSCAQHARTRATPQEAQATGAVSNQPVTRPHASNPKPVAGQTILPFPAPGEDSAASAQRRSMNIPKFGDYVYVSQLPEVIEKASPEYPQLAKQAGVSGVVMVQALVLADGSVGDTRVVRSIPMLDEAAVQCARKWRFKPAQNAQGPTAVWVGVPITFSP